MKHGTLALAMVLVVGFGLGGCAIQPESERVDELNQSSGGSVAVSKDGIASDSILLFDGDERSLQLVKDMEEGSFPTECTVVYDQMGSLPSVTVTDEATVGKVYELLVDVTVGEESPYSITDNYHSVSFVLRDGSRVGFSFEGESLLSRGRQNYTVKGSGPLWAYVRTLQAGVTGGKSAYAISVSDDHDLVLDCPSSAEEGQIVQVVCTDVPDKDVHVYVNGDELPRGKDIFVSVGGSEEKTPAQKKRYEFVMPSTDVDLLVSVS